MMVTMPDTIAMAVAIAPNPTTLSPDINIPNFCARAAIAKAKWKKSVTAR
jgi:hypothetical protein